ncbi:MAG: hypothetical protein IK075_00230, partial [Prevotella sp.]|nr:hypothetical protein [Prevotella sp.]
MRHKKKTSSNWWLKSILAFLIILPYLGLFGVKMMYDKKAEEISNAKFIIIDKETMRLHLIDYR